MDHPEELLTNEEIIELSIEAASTDWSPEHRQRLADRFGFLASGIGAQASDNVVSVDFTKGKTVPEEPTE